MAISKRKLKIIVINIFLYEKFFSLSYTSNLRVGSLEQVGQLHTMPFVLCQFWWKDRCWDLSLSIRIPASKKRMVQRGAHPFSLRFFLEIRSFQLHCIGRTWSYVNLPATKETGIFLWQHVPCYNQEFYH